MYDNIIMTDKVEKHREAVRRYREKLGIVKVRELTKGYIKNKRNDEVFLRPCFGLCYSFN